jgi:phosphoribosylamine--glycine ligase
MRVLIIDADNIGLDFAVRCEAYGHEVRWFRFSKKPTRNGEGFPGITIVEDWKASMPWAKDGLIVTTANAKYMPELDRYRDMGFLIFSPTVRSSRLEIDRKAGLDAMKRVGIDVPEYQVFNGLKEAETFARKSDKSFVFKTMGDNEDKSLSYVSTDPADLVGWLQRKQAQGLNPKGQVMLQEKIDMIAEVGVSGWFGPEGFLPNKWQICFEHKKLMPGNFGPNTGEQGTVCQYVEQDKMAEEMLMPMEAELLKAGHRGDFAIGCGIDSKGKAWPFEFTCRLGWPAFFIQCASHPCDPAKWMYDLLRGEDSLEVSRDVSIGVVLAQPRYPYGDAEPKEVEGNPIAGADEVWDQVHPVDMMIGKGPAMQDGKVVDKPIYQTSGEYVMVVTGLGKTVAQAKDKVYGAVDEIKFSNMIVRNDVGDGVIKKLPELHKFGYAMDMQP